jgi:hypothetical protein
MQELMPGRIWLHRPQRAVIPPLSAEQLNVTCVLDGDPIAPPRRLARRTTRLNFKCPA